jgi:hypothetical protein
MYVRRHWCKDEYVNKGSVTFLCVKVDSQLYCNQSLQSLKNGVEQLSIEVSGITKLKLVL